MELEMANLIMTFVLIGIFVFASMSIAMVFLFGLANKPNKSMISSFVILFLISFSVPITVGIVRYGGTFKSYTSASVKAHIVTYEISPIDKQTALVTATTSIPASVFLKYHDLKTDITTPIMPTHTLEKRIDHSFIIQGIGVTGGTVIFTINGYDEMIDGKPLLITLNQ